LDGNSVLVAHEDTQFAAQVIDLLGDSANRARLGAEARKVAVSTLDWGVLGERLRVLVRATYEGI
jgi:hypothetical protein